jgi:hypothetical protein
MYSTHKSLREYEVTLTSGVWYILAYNVEAAAHAALDLAKKSMVELLNVKQTDEW